VSHYFSLFLREITFFMDESIKIRVRELAALEREKRKKLNERKTVKKTKAGKKFESKEIDGFARIRENEEHFATQLKTGKKTKAGRRTELSSQEKNDLLICENEENFASRLPKNDKKWKIKVIHDQFSYLLNNSG